MENKAKLRLVSYFVMAYLLMAFVWWAVLLYSKNLETFHTKVELLRLSEMANDSYGNEAAFRKSVNFTKLMDYHRRQEKMILLEASMFVLILIVGLWIINNGNDKVIKATQQQRNFLLSITHELKSPIAGIKLVLETISKRQNLSQNQLELLSKNGLQEADRLNSLVNDILMASKIESTFNPLFEPIHINPFFTELTNHLKIKYPNVIFELTLPSQDIILSADKACMTSIFLNLIENGIKYTPQNPAINILITDKTNKLEISIRDNGIGIPDAEKSNVFTKFYRVGNEDTRNTKGTGLGLYIVKELASLHKATIKVKNNTPKGTIFDITFPLN